MSDPARHYLIFGDLHGRVLPAFVLAAARGLAHGVGVDGLLQVGDLGYFPEGYPLDKPTLDFAQDDPMELGVRLVTEPSAAAEAVFFGSSAVAIPPRLWFTAGNHESFDALDERERDAGRGGSSFRVDSDYYGRVWCLRDGQVETLPGALRVGALWGVHGQAGDGSGKHPRAYIRDQSAKVLARSDFDVLLTHDSPREAIRLVDGREEFLEHGSKAVASIIRTAKPRFAFFGHRKGIGGRISGDFGETQIYHLTGMELGRRRGNDLYPEKNCLGLLRWAGAQSRFDYVDDRWLLNFPKSEWLAWEQRLKEESSNRGGQGLLETTSATAPLPWIGSASRAGPDAGAAGEGR